MTWLGSNPGGLDFKIKVVGYSLGEPATVFLTFRFWPFAGFFIVLCHLGFNFEPLGALLSHIQVIILAVVLNITELGPMVLWAFIV